MGSRLTRKIDLTIHWMGGDEREWRLELLRQAQSGEVGALCILREKYGLRLPLVEARLEVRLPWSVDQRSEGGATACPPRTTEADRADRREVTGGSDGARPSA